MLGLWAVLTLTGALFSAWLGYGGRAFAATLTAFAFFFLVMLLFAARGVEMNEARLRMARVPAGAELVENKQSGAPGFWIGNVIVMAGVPSIMQAMLDAAAPKLKTGVKMLSETIRGDVREGDIGTELGEIAKQHPNVTIGSYPFFDEKTGPNTNLVIRSRDAGHLATARAEVEAMLARVRAAVKVNV